MIPERLEQRIMRALRTGAAWQGEILLQRRDGSPMPAFAPNAPVGDFSDGQGGIVGISGPGERAAAIEHQAAHYSEAIRRCFEAA